MAALLQLARAFGKSETPLKHTVLFCAWDGEERGMKGSYDFAQKRVANPEEVALYMNFDMVGRTKDPANPAVTFAWDGHCDNLVQLCRECAERIEQPFVVLYDKRMANGCVVPRCDMVMLMCFQFAERKSESDMIRGIRGQAGLTCHSAKKVPHLSKF